MAVFVSIAPGDVDAKSPISDALMGQIKENEDALQSTLVDGAAATQPIVTDTVEIKGAGVALQVDEDANVDGDFNVGGTLSAGVFFSSEQRLWISGT